jgi:hypothetical protein
MNNLIKRSIYCFEEQDDSCIFKFLEIYPEYKDDISKFIMLDDIDTNEKCNKISTDNINTDLKNDESSMNNTIENEKNKKPIEDKAVPKKWYETLFR